MIGKLLAWEAAFVALFGTLVTRLIWESSQWAQVVERNKRSENTSGSYEDFLELVHTRPSNKEWTHSQPLSPGRAGTIETLQAMRQIVRRDASDPVVRDFAVRLVSDLRGHDFIGEINRVFQFVRDEITYRRDPAEVERVQDTRRTVFKFRSGDCDDKCVALASLLGALGHKSRFVVCGYTRSNFSHVYLEVFTGREWLPLDPTNESADPGWEARSVIRKAFRIF